jgi:hypothetical protein
VNFRDAVLTEVTFANAMAIDRSLITSRLRSGRWQRPYQGVYVTFTSGLSRDAELWAAVCGRARELCSATRPRPSWTALAPGRAG